MTVSKDIKYIGVNDKITDLFEGQYKIPNGISYNSYLVIDDKVTIFASGYFFAKLKIFAEWSGSIC